MKLANRTHPLPEKSCFQSSTLAVMASPTGVPVHPKTPVPLYCCKVAVLPEVSHFSCLEVEDPPPSSYVAHWRDPSFITAKFVNVNAVSPPPPHPESSKRFQRNDVGNVGEGTGGGVGVGRGLGGGCGLGCGPGVPGHH